MPARPVEPTAQRRAPLCLCCFHTLLYPETHYDIVTVSFFGTLDRLGDLKAALRPGGLLFYQHHLRSDPPAEAGPSSQRYRFRSNELLYACLDLTVLYYEESSEYWQGKLSSTVELVARNSHSGTQSYPEPPRPTTGE